VRGPLKTALQQASKHAITVDMWMASSNCSYVGLSAHWLDDNFGTHNKCLEVHLAPGSHTADFI